MDIGSVFTQVWSTNPIWSTSAPSTQATSNGTTQSSAPGTTQSSAPGAFASTLQSVTAELQQVQAGAQTAAGTQANGGQPVPAGTDDGSQATNASDFGDQLGQAAASLAGDALMALQLYAAGPAALFV